MEGKEVVVLCPPPRKEEKIEEYRICEEILHDKCIKEGITVIKWGELIYKSGLGKDVIYYDKVHFSNEGRDLIWNEICGILKQKGVIMKKKIPFLGFLMSAKTSAWHVVQKIIRKQNANINLEFASDVASRMITVSTCVKHTSLYVPYVVDMHIRQQNVRIEREKIDKIRV